MSVIVESTSVQTEIRIGTRNRRVRGPLGTSIWNRQRVTRSEDPIILYYQTVTSPIIENARIRVHENI